MLVKALTGLFLFSLGAICYALLGVLSQLSKAPDGSYAYSPPSVVLLAEFTKLCISFVFLTMEVKSPVKVVRLVVGTSLWPWLLFTVPSALYALNNNLDILNNQYMDPATETVLCQAKILTTGIVWWLVFGQSMGLRKWLSLLLLFAGTVLAGWNREKSASEAKTMYIETTGIFLVSIYVWVSACAGVYNEWLYKRKGGQDESIHASNIRLYAIGCAVNVAGHIWNDSSLEGWLGLTHDYNVYCWALVATYSLMGLLLAQVMKFFDSIVKLFISGSSMYVSAVLSYTIFGYVPTANFTGGMVMVTIAMVMYNLEKIVKLDSKSD